MYDAAAAGLIGFEELLIEALSREKFPEMLLFFYTLLPGLADKSTQKAARKAIYRLEQSGLAAPDEAKPEARAILRGPEKREPRAWVGVIDNIGMRMGILALPDPTGGYDMAVFLGSTQEGFNDFQAWHVTAGKMERAVKELSSHGPKPGLIEAPPSPVRYILNEMAVKHRLLGRVWPRGYAEFVSLMSSVPLPERPGIYEHLTAREALDRVDLPGSVDALLEHDLMAGFALGVELIPYLQKMEEVDTGVLVLSDAQKEERRQGVLEQASREIFTPDALKHLGRRLEETAYMFGLLELPEYAETALAAAVDLERPAEPMDYPFVAAMLKRSWAGITGALDSGGRAGDNKDSEAVVTDSGLIIPPGYGS